MKYYKYFFFILNRSSPAWNLDLSNLSKTYNYIDNTFEFRFNIYCIHRAVCGAFIIHEIVAWQIAFFKPSSTKPSAQISTVISRVPREPTSIFSLSTCIRPWSRARLFTTVICASRTVATRFRPAVLEIVLWDRLLPAIRPPASSWSALYSAGPKIIKTGCIVRLFFLLIENCDLLTILKCHFLRNWGNFKIDFWKRPARIFFLWYYCYQWYEKAPY